MRFRACSLVTRLGNGRRLGQLASLGVLLAFRQAGFAEVGPISAAQTPGVASSAATSIAAVGPATTLYSIGGPSDEEQFLVELINRARANPVAEADRLASLGDPYAVAECLRLGVDFDLMRAQFSTLAPAPPLSINRLLTQAARLQSADMLEHNYQGHVNWVGQDLLQRVKVFGYAPSNLAENVWVAGHSLQDVHASFEIDWGTNPYTGQSVGGMQSPPGHRLTIHDAAYNEIGVGLIRGQKGAVGPIVTTQDFGRSKTPRVFITGVAYFDLDQNGAYDAGEGLGGLTVTATGCSYHAITSSSGGYSIPVPGDGPYTVAFAGNGLASAAALVNVSGGQNAKVDFTPAYAPPLMVGPETVAYGKPETFTFSALGGATSYECQQTLRFPYQRAQGAEVETDDVFFETTPGYATQVASPVHSGKAAFRLGHPVPERQTLLLPPRLRLGSGSQLTFYSRLGWASTGQVAGVELTRNEGVDWVELWSQTGTRTEGQTNYVQRVIPLAPYAGATVQFRFVFDYLGDTYYAPNLEGVGWYLDDIRVSDAEESSVSQVVPVDQANQFVFQPTDVARVELRLRARTGQKAWEWGPAQMVSVTAPAWPVVRLQRTQAVLNGDYRLTYRLQCGQPTSFQLYRSDSLRGPWRPEPGLTPVALGDGIYRLTTKPPAGAGWFYRVGAK